MARSGLTRPGLTGRLRTGSRLARTLPGDRTLPGNGTALRLPRPDDPPGAPPRRAGRGLTGAGDLSGGADDSGGAGGHRAGAAGYGGCADTFSTGHHGRHDRRSADGDSGTRTAATGGVGTTATSGVGATTAGGVGATTAGGVGATTGTSSAATADRPGAGLVIGIRHTVLTGTTEPIRGTVLTGTTSRRHTMLTGTAGRRTLRGTMLTGTTRRRTFRGTMLTRTTGGRRRIRAAVPATGLRWIGVGARVRGRTGVAGTEGLSVSPRDGGHRTTGSPRRTGRPGAGAEAVALITRRLGRGVAAASGASLLRGGVTGREARLLVPGRPARG